jgi:hypothetical protein
MKVLFQLPKPQKAFWDAAKKSLDAAQKPVNLRPLNGIKDLWRARSKLAIQRIQGEQNDSIIGRAA